MTTMTVGFGKGITRTVDLAKLGFTQELPLNSVCRHIVYLGVKNSVQDSHAEFTKKDNPLTYKADSEKAIDKKLDAYYRGELRVSRDPIDAEAIAVDQLTQNTDAVIAKLNADPKAMADLIAKFQASVKKGQRAGATS